MTDIVERLRNPYGQTGADRRRNIKEAADELDRLRKALQFIADKSQALAMTENYLRELRWKEINALKAENAELRNALRNIADPDTDYEAGIEIARAALQKDEGE